MNLKPIQPVVSDFRFGASRFRPRKIITPRPLATSASTPPAGHCQSRRRRTETSRARNASASLTLNRIDVRA